MEELKAEYKRVNRKIFKLVMDVIPERRKFCHGNIERLVKLKLLEEKKWRLEAKKRRLYMEIYSSEYNKY